MTKAVSHFIAYLGLMSPLLLTGCQSIESTLASADFMRYEGESADFMGQGGSNQQIDGIDVWVDGFPKKRYRILGTVTAKGYTEDGRLKEAIQTAKGYQADALIAMQQYGNPTNPQAGFGAMGGSGFGFGAGVGLSVPLERPESVYLAVKYLKH